MSLINGKARNVYEIREWYEELYDKQEFSVGYCTCYCSKCNCPVKTPPKPLADLLYISVMGLVYITSSCSWMHPTETDCGVCYRVVSLAIVSFAWM
jgi:hypothetical protein